LIIAKSSTVLFGNYPVVVFGQHFFHRRRGLYGLIDDAKGAA